ncbi:MAG TPA: hypothetical protein VIO10_00310 [Candidatus Binatus sp.]
MVAFDTNLSTVMATLQFHRAKQVLRAFISEFPVLQGKTGNLLDLGFYRVKRPPEMPSFL